MIRRIDISGYRSCLRTVFLPHPRLSVLIGPNASGKTNILNAVLLLNQLARGRFARRAPEKRIYAPVSIRVVFAIRGRIVTLNAKLQIDTDETNDDVIVQSTERWSIPDRSGKQRHYNVPLVAALPRSRMRLPHHTMWHVPPQYPRLAGRFFDPSKLPPDVRSVIQEISQFLSRLNYYGASQFTNPGNCPSSIELDEGGRLIPSYRTGSHESFVIDLYNQYRLLKNPSFQQFLDVIGPRGMRLIDRMTFRRITLSSVQYSIRPGIRIRKQTRGRFLIIPQFRLGRHTLSPNQLSQGTFRAIVLVFYIMTRASRMLLIEEPEVCVHHGLLASIVELVKSQVTDKQIVVTTHSDFVLDHVQPESVFRVALNKRTGTTVSTIAASMSARELGALRTYLATEGNLGEYWRHGGLE